MYSVEVAQEELLAFLDAQFVQPVLEQAIPDIDTVKRNTRGEIEPYLAVSFGSMFPGSSRSMVGPWGDDHVITLRVQVIAPTPKIARRLANKLDQVLIGLSPTNTTGSVSKSRVGGAIFPIVTSTGATEAYTYATSYSVAVQLTEDA